MTHTKKHTKKSEPISLRAYAEQRDVSHQAVRRAIASGRLRESVVTVGGEPKIADPALADREWEANTRPRADRCAATRRPRTPAQAPTDIVLTDTAMDCEVTAGELFEDRDAYSLLATALASLALDAAIAPDQVVALNGPVVAQLRERVGAQLRAVAELHHADAEAVRRAADALETRLWMLAEVRQQDSAA